MIDYTKLAKALGRANTYAHEKTVAGKNRSLSNIDFNPTLDPYRKEWTKNWFADFSKEHRGRAMASFNILAQILRDTASRFNCVFEIETDTPSRLKSILRPLGDDSLDAIAETPALNGPFNSTWIPEYAIILEASPSGKANTSILFEGKRYTVNLQACDFGPFLERLCTLPLGCEKAILRRHYMKLIPKSLKDKYKTVTIVEDAGLQHEKGFKYYGHLAELKMDENHIFKYAYPASEYSAGPDDHYVEETYRLLKEISAIVPDLPIIIYDTFELTSILADEFSSDTEFVMNMIHLMPKPVTEETLKRFVDKFQLAPISPTGKSNDSSALVKELYRDYTQGYTWRKIKFVEIYNNMDIAKTDWILFEAWNNLELLVVNVGQKIDPHFDPHFNVVVNIPYNCPNSVYLKILNAKPLLNQLAKTLSKYNTAVSVGVFPV